MNRGHLGDNEEDYDHPTWAGVIPVRSIIGEAESYSRVIPGVEKPETLSIYRPGAVLDEPLMAAQRMYERQSEA